MTWTKICGTTNLADAQLAAAAGADAIGFIFVASPREIRAAAAREITEALPERVEKIGVVVNLSPDAVAHLADIAGLTGIQLHGDEPAEEICKYRSELGSRLILKTLQARQVLAHNDDYLLPYLERSEFFDAILLDAGVPGQRGGTGVPFDWEALAPAVSQIKQRMPVIIAGGLTPQNVPEALRIFEPWGVDVASGVEAEVGRKDETKVRAFVGAVRTASGSQVAAR